VYNIRKLPVKINSALMIMPNLVYHGEAIAGLAQVQV